MSTGAIKIQEPYIDYTEVAAPLTFDQIADDITQIHLQFYSPSKLRLWEHQVDWLIKQLPPAINALNKAPLTIWGIPVEVKIP